MILAMSGRYNDNIDYDAIGGFSINKLRYI